MSEHLDGFPVSAHNGDWPVSASTYGNGHCRCGDCLAAHRYHRSTSPRVKLTQKARARATNRALQWVIREFPDVWMEYLSGKRAELEGEYPEMAVDRRKGPR